MCPLWPLAATPATTSERETVHQIATALAMIFHEQRQDPLAASKAVMAVADAYHLKVELPAELATSREVPTRRAPQVFGWFQPPWEIDEANVDFTAFSHHAGVDQYDGNCNTSWYNHDTVGKVCPYADALLNNAPPPVNSMFVDGFESGDTSAWSSTIQ